MARTKHKQLNTHTNSFGQSKGKKTIQCACEFKSVIYNRIGKGKANHGTNKAQTFEHAHTHIRSDGARQIYLQWTCESRRAIDNRIEECKANHGMNQAQAFEHAHTHTHTRTQTDRQTHAHTPTHLFGQGNGKILQLACEFRFAISITALKQCSKAWNDQNTNI